MILAPAGLGAGQASAETPSMMVLAPVHQPGLNKARQAARTVPAELPIHGDCRDWIPKLPFHGRDVP